MVLDCPRRRDKEKAMHGGAAELTGWFISGFETQVVLWCWVVFVLFYGLYRSVKNPAPDAMRDSGPVV